LDNKLAKMSSEERTLLHGSCDSSPQRHIFRSHRPTLSSASNRRTLVYVGSC
jgi:hypothetical protein